MGKTVREYLDTAKKKFDQLMEWDGGGKVGEDFVVEEEDFETDGEVLGIDLVANGNVCEIDINPEYEDKSINGKNLNDFIMNLCNIPEFEFKKPILEIYETNYIKGLIFSGNIDDIYKPDKWDFYSWGIISSIDICQIVASVLTHTIVNNQCLEQKEAGVKTNTIKLYIKYNKNIEVDYNKFKNVLPIDLLQKNEIIQNKNDYFHEVVLGENEKPIGKIDIIEDYIKVLKSGNKKLISQFDIPDAIFKGYCETRTINTPCLYLSIKRPKLFSYNIDDYECEKIAKFCNFYGIDEVCITNFEEDVMELFEKNGYKQCGNTSIALEYNYEFEPYKHYMVYNAKKFKVPQYKDIK